MNTPAITPTGRAPWLLFVGGILLVVTATLMGLRILMPGMLEILLPPDFFPVEAWQAGALFFLGFAMVASAQMLGADRQAQAPESKPTSPTGALLADVPEDVELVHKAVADKLSPKKKTLGHALALFTISLILFAIQIGVQHDFYFMWIVALLVVLFVHELGHLLTMWAFGYSGLRMFFIPMFGAAASGRKHNATATQRAIVSLMGPAPGLVFALVAMFFEPFESRFLHDLAQLALIINAFNLAPFVPLDGGNVIAAAWPQVRSLAPSARRSVLLFGAYGASFLMVAVAWLGSVLIESEEGGYTWHANGQPHSFGKPGVYGPEGAWIYWHPNGAESAAGVFVDAVKEGAWHYWNADGSLESEGNYVGGQKVGIWSSRSEDGVEETRDFGVLPPPVVLTLDEYHTLIRCHFDNEKSVDAALNCAESAFRVAARFLPQTSDEPELARFHLFRNRADYRLAEWRKTKGRYKDNIVFTLYDEASTYTYVSPSASDEELDKIGLPRPTLERIARAAALNVLAWRMPAFHELPEGLEAGFRAYVAQRATNPSGASLRTASWFKLAARLATEGRLPTAADIITTDLQAFTKDARYALRAAIFGFMSQGDELPRLFAALAAHAKDDKAGFRATLDAWLTPAKLESLDAGLAEFLKE